jgi:tetratricopeptide (TPR) repeat protein
MTKVKRGWWEHDPDAPAVPRRDAKPPGSASLRWARELCGVEQEELAARSGFKLETIKYMERGKEEPGIANLELLMASLGVSPATLEDLLALAEEVRGGIQDTWVGPVLLSGTLLRRAREFGRKMGNLERRDLGDYVVRELVQKQATEDREIATEIGNYLRGKQKLVDFVRENAGCHLWSVAEWLCTESMHLASRDRDRAAECAEAALAVAELAPCGEGFRTRLLGYGFAHRGNILRVKNAFPESDLTFAKYLTLWLEGAAGDPYGVLDGGRLMGMEASLRREQGRFIEALRLLRGAMAVATREIQPYLRLNCGIVLEQMGDSEGAIRVLEEAAEKAPRSLLFFARFRVGVSLCHLGRHQEAEVLLPEVVRLGIETGSKDYQMRVRWLSARIAAGHRKTEEALGVLKSVQREFLEQGNAYDAVLVSLDLAKLYLEQGETAVVKRLAEEMAPVFADKGVHHHAQEALKLFAAAARREAASVEFVVRVLTYLERAQRSHGLRFEGIAA